MFDGPLITALLKLVGLLMLAGALVPIGFVAVQVTRKAPEGAGDPNWRFLFSCWADSMAITVLFTASAFGSLYEGLVAVQGVAASNLDPTSDYVTRGYVMLVMQAVIYGLSLVIGIRLYLRIRRFLERG